MRFFLNDSHMVIQRIKTSAFIVFQLENLGRQGRKWLGSKNIFKAFFESVYAGIFTVINLMISEAIVSYLEFKSISTKNSFYRVFIHLSEMWFQIKIYSIILCLYYKIILQNLLIYFIYLFLFSFGRHQVYLFSF